MNGPSRRAPKARRVQVRQRGRVHPTPASAAFRYRGHDCVVRLEADGTWQWQAFGPGQSYAATSGLRSKSDAVRDCKRHCDAQTAREAAE